MSRASISALMSLAFVSSVSAATLNVPADFTSIQDALDNAVAGDEVVLAAGVYTANLTLDTPGVVIRSSSPTDGATIAATVLDGAGARIVDWMTTADNCELRGVTFRNGAAPGSAGGAIGLSSVSGVISHCVFENNANSAIGMQASVVDAEQFAIEYCTFHGNTSVGNGGALALINDWVDNAVTMDISIAACDFAWNSAQGSGGAIFTWTRVDRIRYTIEDCTFSANHAGQCGAIEFFGEVSPTPAVVERCDFHDNYGTLYSGAMRVRTPATVADSTFSANRGPDGGAISVVGAGTLNISNTAFCDNTLTVISGDYIDAGGLSFTDSCNGACCLGESCVMISSADCLAAGGIFAADTECASASCDVPCPFDVTGDAQIGFEDLVAILSAWGPCP